METPRASSLSIYTLWAFSLSMSLQLSLLFRDSLILHIAYESKA